MSSIKSIHYRTLISLDTLFLFNTFYIWYDSVGIQFIGFDH